MNVYRTRQIDNRDSEQMYAYFEARIEVLKRRISDLEKENRVLRVGRSQEFHVAVAQKKAVTSEK
jgi:hypothetical protein